MSGLLVVDLDLNAWAQAMKVGTLNQPARELNREWKDNAVLRLKEKYSGGPMSRYLTARSGKTRRNVRGRLVTGGAELSVSGPGVFLQEFGGIILPKKGTRLRNGRMIPYLTFRLFQPQDTSKPTGRWVRVRSATIRAKYPARDSAREALASLYLDLEDA